MKTILDKITWVRNKKGIRQAKIAKIMGLTVSAYSKMEIGRKPISLTRLHQIADILEVKCSAILDVEDPTEKYIDAVLINTLHKLWDCNRKVILAQKELIILHEELRELKLTSNINHI